MINDPVEQLLALEMVRVTEEAAIASARAMGRGDRNGADKLATEAMRSTMEEIDFAGRIVIGEGERDEAPMLYIGEEVRRAHRDPSAPRVDIAVDPWRGTNLVAHGARPGAITVLAASETGGLTHAPTRTWRSCASDRWPRAGSTSATPRRQPPGDRLRARAEGQRHHRRHPRATAPRRPSSPRSARPGRGSSSSATATCRPRSRRAVSGTGVHAVIGHRRRARGRDHGRRAALPRRRDPGPLPLPQRRGARARRRMGHGDEAASTGRRTWHRARTSSSRRPG